MNVLTRFVFCLLYPFSDLHAYSFPAYATARYMYICPPSPLSVTLTLCLMTSTQLGEGGRCCSGAGWDTTGAGWDTTGAGWDTTGAGWDTIFFIHSISSEIYILQKL